MCLNRSDIYDNSLELHKALQREKKSHVERLRQAQAENHKPMLEALKSVAIATVNFQEPQVDTLFCDILPKPSFNICSGIAVEQ